jgi:SAM-dependent methyltransferase
MTGQESIAYLDTIPANGVLKTKAEVNRSIKVLKALGLPLHMDAPKNWDSLAALAILTRSFSGKKSAKILDAGGESYSVILKQLQQFGWMDLTCINITYAGTSVSGGIRFRYGDITRTRFAGNRFDVITCLSVIEHGVDVNRYFKEASRILKPGGILFTSMDYWTTPIDTGGQVAYGVPIRIFDRTEVKKMVEQALEYDLELVGRLDLDCTNKVVSWKQFDLDYTFLYFTMRKRQFSTSKNTGHKGHEEDTKNTR